MSSTHLNRRDFLKAGLAGSLLFSSGLRGKTGTTVTVGNARQARNVILLVSDGMSLGTLTTTERYKQMMEGRGTNWINLYTSGKNVRRALVDTCSASSPVTDSAAGSSAWGCGHKVKNGTFNCTPDGKPLPTIVRMAKAAGYGTGLVTTARVTHATPAGFTVQLVSRVDEGLVAEQYLDIGVDVLLGGGRSYFDPGSRNDEKDMFAAFEKEDYQVVKTAEELRTAGDGRILGTFAHSHLPLKIDRASDPAADSIPTLPEMTRHALRRLEKNPRGFLLLVEGALVDIAAHANDIGSLLQEQLDFDEALGVALEFVANRDDTLLIVTTDHGNANPGLNGRGGNFDSRNGSYGDTQKCFERLKGFRRSNRWIMDKLTRQSKAAQIRDRVKEATGVELRDDEIDLMQRAMGKDPAPREGYRVRNRAPITLAQILSNHTSVGWSGTAHTSDFVELGAIGPGSESIGGLMQNTDLFGVMARALDLKI